MRRVFPLSIALFAIVMLGLATLQGTLIALAFPVILYLAAGLILSPVDIDLSATRSVHLDRTRPGGPMTIHVKVTNHGSPLKTLIVEDHLPDGLEPLEGETHLLCSLEPSETLDLSYTAQAHRGRYSFQDLTVSVMDPLWLTVRKVTIPAAAQILIQPTVEPIERIPIRPRNTKVYAGYIPSRRGGSGVDFFGVRQYRPGDPLRWINWKASARFQHTFFINQYEQYRVADVSIILDTRRGSEIRTEGGESLFEHSVVAAASVANRFLEDGNRVGLLLYGAKLGWTIPGYSKIQKERIQNSLARAEPGESMVFDKLENLPTLFLPPKSQIVLITPLQGEDLPVLINLRSHGYTVLVVSPDPIAFEKRQMERREANVDRAIKFAQLERQALMKLLRQAGIQVVNWDVRERLQIALQRSHQRPKTGAYRRGIMR